MNVQNLLNQFLGTQDISHGQGASHVSELKNMASNVSSKMGGFGSGAALGGLAALLVSSKKVRSFAGSAAKVGGAALLGGLAFKAFKNWQNTKQTNQSLRQQRADYSDQISLQTAESFESQVHENTAFQLTLVKAMIAAAKADGHIDDIEQTRIFDAVEEMPSSSDLKFLMMDLLRYPPTIQELVFETKTFEQKSELYLISCFAIDVDNEAESQYLNKLAKALGLPNELARELQQQANQAALQAA